MEKLQSTFPEAYIRSLRDEVLLGQSIEKYLANDFDYDVTKVRYVANVYKPEGLLDNMLSVVDNDYKAAVLLFEAYKDLTPVLASSENFWAYLCHVDLFEYCKKRWPFDNIGNLKSYILDHWFFGKGYNRNALASLWWCVKISYDENNTLNPYHLTEIFFKNYSFRTTWLTVMLRIKDGLLGILEFLKENPNVMNEYFENRGLYIAKYFNTLGGSKQLSYLPREFFKEELNKILPDILTVKKREDVK